MRLTDECGGGAGPIGVLELEPERHVEGKTDRDHSRTPKSNGGPAAPTTFVKVSDRVGKILAPIQLRASNVPGIGICPNDWEAQFC
jgi:hypothetical protein